MIHQSASSKLLLTYVMVGTFAIFICVFIMHLLGWIEFVSSRMQRNLRILLLVQFIGGVIAFKMGLIELDPQAAVQAIGQIAVRKHEQRVDDQYQKIAPKLGTLGFRNNNPMVLRASAGRIWEGQTGASESGFAIFQSPEMGIRAGMRLLLTYQDKSGLSTLRQIVDRWTVGDDAYLGDIVKRLGVAADRRVDLHDPIVLKSIVKAMIEEENRGHLYSDEILNYALLRAGVEVPNK